jgi:hypothetical protein
MEVLSTIGLVLILLLSLGGVLVILKTIFDLADAITAASKAQARLFNLIADEIEYAQEEDEKTEDAQ